MLADFHLSYRRRLIDADLTRINESFAGNLLDLGGKKNHKRGRFIPDTRNVRCWAYLNRSIREAPDVVADGMKLPFRNSIFNWVVCTEVLEFIKDPDLLIGEIKRVLLGEGQLVLTSPFLYRIHDHPYDLQRFTDTKLRELLERHSFRVTVLKAQGYYFTVLADFIMSAVAHIESKVVRSVCKVFFTPLILFLAALDQQDWVRQSTFLSSFTTGYFLVAKKLSNE